MISWVLEAACSALNAGDWPSLFAALGVPEGAEDINKGDLSLILLCFWLRIAALLGVVAAALLALISYRAKVQRELPLIIAGLALTAAGACFWMSLGLIPDA